MSDRVKIKSLSAVTALAADDVLVVVDVSDTEQSVGGSTRKVTVANAQESLGVNDKVDKIDGKGLSTEDYTTTEKNKLAGIEESANSYAHPNHTGDVTSAGDGATTLSNSAVTGKSTVTAEGVDFILISDTSDSGNLKKALVSDIEGSGGGDGTWGSITGTLSDQTDLQSALDGKASTSHSHTASNITDFDAEVSNNTDVAANTSARHAAVTVTDSGEIDFTLTGQNITASIVAGSIDETKLDTSTNASLDLADSSVQPADIANFETTTQLNTRDTNNRARSNHTGTQTASTISDFDTEVSNNPDVTANTAKITNATHTGEVTGSGALTLDKTAITNKTLVTAVGSDHLLIADASDGGNLKKVLASDLTGAGGSVAWGSVTGTLTDQTDLDTALDGKSDVSHTHTAANITDFDTEVSNNADVVANTAKVTNATHTGDVTGATALTIANRAVTYAKMQDVTASRLLGRATASAGVVEEISLNSTLSFSGGSLRRAGLTGDVTASAGNNSTTIANNAVTNAKAADMAQNTIKGRITASTGDPEDLTATQVRTIINVEDAADVTDAVNVGTSIHGTTAKTTPVDADTLALIDSADSNALKKLSWTNVKATLKTYFDTLYPPVDGWFSEGTWTYSAYDSTYKLATITVPTGAASRFHVGTKVKFSQTTDGQKYGIVVEITSTTSIKVDMGNNYDFDNEAITDAYRAFVRRPLDFPNRLAFDRRIADTSSSSQSSPTGGTWYNLGSVQLAVCRGVWRIKYGANVLTRSASDTDSLMQTTLSVSSSAESESEMSTLIGAYGATGDIRSYQMVSRERDINLTSDETFYLLESGVAGGATPTFIQIRGDFGDTVIEAINLLY